MGSFSVYWAIDGCPIPIAAPVGNRTDYYNCKGFYSILLQGVDADYYFLDVCMGFGSTWDLTFTRECKMGRNQRFDMGNFDIHHTMKVMALKLSPIGLYRGTMHSQCFESWYVSFTILKITQTGVQATSWYCIQRLAEGIKNQPQQSKLDYRRSSVHFKKLLKEEVVVHVSSSWLQLVWQLKHGYVSMYKSIPHTIWLVAGANLKAENNRYYLISCSQASLEIGIFLPVKYLLVNFCVV